MIYDLIRQGRSTSDVLAVVGGTRSSVSVLSWKIRRPEDSNRAGRKKR
jgi:hypothetical protein